MIDKIRGAKDIKKTGTSYIIEKEAHKNLLMGVWHKILSFRFFSQVSCLSQFLTLQKYANEEKNSLSSMETVFSLWNDLFIVLLKYFKQIKNVPF